MVKVKHGNSRFLNVLLLPILLSACGGASESEFIEACLIEAGDRSAQQVAVCECGADAASSSLSGDAHRAMVLEMAGRGAEASEVTSKMSQAEQIKMVEAVSSIFDRCFLN